MARFVQYYVEFVRKEEMIPETGVILADAVRYSRKIVYATIDLRENKRTCYMGLNGLVDAPHLSADLHSLEINIFLRTARLGDE